jgi:hypothetical protein
LPDSKDIFTLYQVGTWEATGPGSMGPGYGPSRPTYKFTIKSYKDFFNDKEYLISSDVNIY